MLDETVTAWDRPTVAVVWGGLALAAYAAGLLCLIGSGRCSDLGLIRWKIGSWILLSYGLVFGITTVTFLGPQYGEAAELALTSVLRALWLVAVGITMWALGYVIGPGQPSRRLAARGISALSARFTAEVRSPLVPWILYAIGIAASLVTTATTGRLGYVGTTSAVNTSGYGQELSLVSECAPLAIAVAALQVFRDRLPGARITLTVLLLIQIGVGAVAGTKGSFVFAALAVVIPFSAVRRRLPKAPLIVLVTFFFAVVVPFNLAYRHAVTDNGRLTPSEAIAAAPEILRQAVGVQSLSSIVPDSIDFLEQRLQEIDNPAIVLQRYTHSDRVPQSN